MSNETNPPRPEETEPVKEESAMQAPAPEQEEAEKHPRLLLVLIPVTVVLIALAALSILRGGTLFGSIGRFLRYSGDETPFPLMPTAPTAM